MWSVMWGGFRWANPWQLRLLLLLPILAVFSFYAFRFTHKKLTKAFGERLTPSLLASFSNARKKIKLSLKLLALFFWILAAARPQMGGASQTIKSQGVELVIALDVSLSMLAEDVRPNRLEVAKSQVSKLLNLLGGDKAALVAFAGSALLISPLTTDKSSLQMLLEGLSPQSVQNQGTDFQNAFQEAQQIFERGGADLDDKDRATRVILVVSDGEDQEKGAEEYAQRLANKGIRIFTMAVGTEEGGPIPLRSALGGEGEYKLDREGHQVISHVNFKMLSNLAASGHGRHVVGSYSGPEAEEIFSEINRLDKADFDDQVQRNYIELYQYFLLIGILLLLIDLLLPERARKLHAEQAWKGRFPIVLLFLFLPISVLWPKSAAWAQVNERQVLTSPLPFVELQAIHINNKGVDAYQHEELPKARDNFLYSLGKFPYDPRLHYNLACTLWAQKQNKDAIQQAEVARLQAESVHDENLQFASLFLMGVASTGIEKKRVTLDYYQRALKFQPQSEEVKTNIELLMQVQSSTQSSSDQSNSNDDEEDDQEHSKSSQDKQKDKEPQKEQQSQGKEQKKQPEKFQNGDQKDKDKDKDKSNKQTPQLRQKDMESILEELKNQEEEIRSRAQSQQFMDEENREINEQSKEKDW